MALAMLMTFAFLGQRQLRLALAQVNASLPDQKGRPTARPTLR